MLFRSDQMGRLLDDETLCNRLSETGKARAKALLRWETERAQLLAAYDLLLKDRSATAGIAQPMG